MSLLHLVDELSCKIAFVVNHSITFIEARYDTVNNLLHCLSFHVSQQPEELLVQKSAHVVCFEF
jgi:hypothetical protein